MPPATRRESLFAYRLRASVIIERAVASRSTLGEEAGTASARGNRRCACERGLGRPRCCGREPKRRAWRRGARVPARLGPWLRRLRAVRGRQGRWRRRGEEGRDVPYKRRSTGREVLEGFLDGSTRALPPAPFLVPVDRRRNEVYEHARPDAPQSKGVLVPSARDNGGVARGGAALAAPREG